MLISSLLSLSLVSIASASPLSTNPSYATFNRLAAPSLSLAPFHAASHQSKAINNSYIVIFKDSAPASALDSHLSLLSSLQDANANALAGFDGDDSGERSGLNHVWTSHIMGYSGRFASEVVDLIRAQPEVEFVEQDSVVTTLEKQKAAPWGLARVSHRKKLTLSTFNTYEFTKEGGEGVDVYVVDTGVFINHTEFEGRASWGKTIPQNDQDIDGNGHGTHCAGTIASRKYGVAKKANIIAVKVLGTNGSGSMSDVVAGVLFAADSALAKARAAVAEFIKTGKTSHKGSVANMSLGGGKSPALDRAVDKAVQSGLNFAVAAGNDNQDACNYSPAASSEAVTVGASTLADGRASFSNWGTCVDVFAPGLNIKSTWNGHETDENTISGTSMASPHTAGMLAYLLSIYPSATFDPEIPKSSIRDEIDLSKDLYTALAETEMSLSKLYRIVHSYLPPTLHGLLPSPALLSQTQMSFAPIPEPKIPVLSPVQLKKALLKLSTPDVLADVGKGSPNLLIFNNATAPNGKSWTEVEVEQKVWWESVLA